MSTLKVTNIAGLTGSSTNVVEGLAKMWVAVIDSGTASATDSFNSSSITDVGGGKYDVNLTNAMINTNQGVGGIADDGAANPQRGFSAHQTSTTKYGCGTFYPAFNGYSDGNFTCMAVGGLA